MQKQGTWSWLDRHQSEGAKERVLDWQTDVILITLNLRVFSLLKGEERRKGSEMSGYDMRGEGRRGEKGRGEE